MPSPHPAAVSLSSVTKIFEGKDPALVNATISFSRGSLTAIVGPSGSGKTTLLKMVAGLTKPDSGEIKVFDKVLANLNSRELRKLRSQVGFVFQSFGLVSRLSALENVMMGALGSLRMPRLGVASYPKELQQRGVRNLERVGLKEVAFRRVDTLSGGQMQRVAVARAMMQQPQILLADEPIASLDPESSRSVMDLVARLCREDGITAIVSLHQIEFALGWSDRVVALKSGKVFLDKPSSAVKSEELENLFAKSDEQNDQSK